MENTMKTEAARTAPAAQSAAQQSAARPAAQQPAPQPAAQPVRRIGSITLGVALMACGVCLLLFYFWPGFDYLLAVKLAPVCLIGLGAEVLFFSARPGKGRYDFLSILICLVLVGAAFCISLLPVVWDYIGPDRSAAEETMENQLEEQLYGMLRGSSVSALEVRVSLGSGQTSATTLDQLDGREYVWISAELSGEYASAEEFAAQCRLVADAVQKLPVQPDDVNMQWIAPVPGEPGHLTERASLTLSSPYQLDWDAHTMAAYLYWDEQAGSVPVDGADLTPPQEEQADPGSEL